MLFKRKISQSTTFAAVLLMTAIYHAGPQSAAGWSMKSRGGEETPKCDSTGLHDEKCTYKGTGNPAPCSSAKYNAAYATTNSDAWLDKLKDPGGGNFSNCNFYADCTPIRDDRLLEQTCTKVKGSIDPP